MEGCRGLCEMMSGIAGHDLRYEMMSYIAENDLQYEKMGNAMKQTLLDLLNKMIEEHNANQTELCRGLCSNAAFSRYINGERRMDRLLLSAMMQRLGRSPDKFVSLLTDAEYRYFDWRLRLLNLVVDMDWEGAGRLLSEREIPDKELNEPLQEQFYLMMRGLLQERLRGDREGATAFFYRAIRATIPGFTGKLRPQSVLCVQEINALLLWQECLRNEAISAELLEVLAHYAYCHFEDEQERVKVYPRLVAECLPYFRKEERYEEIYTISKQAFSMMMSLRYFVCGEQVLGAYIEAAEKLGKAEEVAKRKVQLASWYAMREELRSDGGIVDDACAESRGSAQTAAAPRSALTGRGDEWYVWDLWQEPELLREVIERRRKQRGISQEVLSEDICTPETLSRIVTGKRAPSRRNFKALAKKLAVREDYYYSMIEADDFRLLEERFRLDWMIETKQWQKAKEAAKRLESQLDMENRYNRQYLGEIYYIIELVQSEIPSGEQMERLLSLLKLTKPDYPLTERVREWPEAFWCTVFTSEEISIMTQMTSTLRRNGKAEDSIYLTEKLYGYYKKSVVRPEFHFRTLMGILAQLSILHGTPGHYEECIRYSQEGIALCFVSRKMSDMGLFVNNIANAKECLGDKAFALRYYRYAFYCAELFCKDSEIPRRSYEKLNGKEIEWY
ncbi:MAG: helix-turn-helix domain-containing protein [Lachnospiraceae bacterium]|nr:helix-turn-helix domain-containing protein [Lachnospiraceae bacterium]